VDNSARVGGVPTLPSHVGRRPAQGLSRVMRTYVSSRCQGEVCCLRGSAVSWRSRGGVTVVLIVRGALGASLWT
jgi:hypothetical protein